MASEAELGALLGAGGALDADTAEYAAGVAAGAAEEAQEAGAGPAERAEAVAEAVLPFLEDAALLGEVARELALRVGRAAAGLVAGGAAAECPGAGGGGADAAGGSHGRELLVDCRGIILAYPGSAKPLLRRADLTLRRGGRYGIVGRNGTGKTTLMSRVAERDIAGFPSDVRTALVQHEVTGCDERETALDYFRRLDGASAPVNGRAGGEDGERRWQRALERVGFSGEMLAKPVEELSGGWRMRLAIARGSLSEAELILLDEPTNHLDVEAVAWLAEYLTSGTSAECVVVVSHDYPFLEKMASDIILFDDGLLKYYEGGFAGFRAERPEVIAELPSVGGLTLEEGPGGGGGGVGGGGGGDGGEGGEEVVLRGRARVTAQQASRKTVLPLQLPPGSLPLALPDPGLLEGVKSRARTVLKLNNLTFGYPGGDDLVLRGCSGRLALKSRVALVGPNGAGKTTLLRLLVGDLELMAAGGESGGGGAAGEGGEQPPPATGQAPGGGGKRDRGRKGREATAHEQVWKHHNLRVSYIAQHFLHHLEQNLHQDPKQYIQERYLKGQDKELAKMATLKLTEEEVLQSQATGRVREVVGRAMRGGGLAYEVRKSGRRDTETVWEQLVDLKHGPSYVMKLVRNYDERMKVIQSGVAVRPISSVEVLKHLQGFGIAGELARNPIRGMSGGQKSRLVLAAAMWNMPHIIALDEPTNYLDNETLAVLAHGLQNYKGAVLTISHNRAFLESLQLTERWRVVDGRVKVEEVEAA